MIAKQLSFVLLCVWICACSSVFDVDRANRCEVTEIDAVFAAPLDFDGQRFCGFGYYYGNDFGGVYASPITNVRDAYGVAFLFDARSRSGPWVTIGENARVYVEGTIDASCHRGMPQPPGEGCAPVTGAIFLEDWVIRVVR